MLICTTVHWTDPMVHARSLKQVIHVRKWNEEKKKPSKQNTNSKVKLSAVNPLLTPTNSAEAAAGIWNRGYCGEISAPDSYKWNALASVSS